MAACPSAWRVANFLRSRSPIALAAYSNIILRNVQICRSRKFKIASRSRPGTFTGRVCFSCGRTEVGRGCGKTSLLAVGEPARGLEPAYQKLTVWGPVTSTWPCNALPADVTRSLSRKSGCGKLAALTHD